MKERAGRIQITGLAPDEETLIKDAARIRNQTIRSWAIEHARNDAAEARWARPVETRRTTPEETPDA